MTLEPFPSEQRAGLYRAISERRDIRNYRPDPVPQEVLERLLDAAHRAPSVGLMQPWNFIVVRDRTLRKEVYDHFRSVNELAASVHPGDRGQAYRALKLQGILDAPLNLLVTCDRGRGGTHVLGRFTMRHMDEYSTCLAIQNLWLAARAEGVGVGWLSLLEPEFIATCFGLPEPVVPVAYLTLGYPVEFPSEPLLERTGWSERRPLASAVFLDHFGAPYELGAETLTGTVEVHDARPVSEAPRTRTRQAELTKPRGSLGQLEELAIQLGQLQAVEHPTCRAPSLLLFAGDHGVAVEGVSAYLPRATAQMVYMYLAGGAATNALCRQHGVQLLVADVGVDHDFGQGGELRHHKVRRGTRNFLHEPAMTELELTAALNAGAEMVQSVSNSDVIALGEMGIGNTTAAAALFAALTDSSVEESVGAGTGVSAPTLARKRHVIGLALARHPSRNAEDALRCLGGFEIAALVGAIEAAASLGRLVVLDGFVTGVAALIAQARNPAVLSSLVAGHVSAERAHRALLAHLSLRPLLDLDLRLGEGSGAVLALPLIESACRLTREMRTFEEANLVRPLDPRDARA